MYFTISKYLTPFVMPVGVACVGLLLAILFSWRKPWLARFFLVLVLAILAGLGNGAVSQRLMAPLETSYPVPVPGRHAVAAVVLGGAVDVIHSTPERIEFYDRPERIVEGVRLVKSGRVDWLVLSGGSGNPVRPKGSEARLMAAFARQMGVDPSILIMQERGRTTHEDAVYTAAMLKERGIASFFLVTSASHMPRAMGCFRKAGLDPIPYPVDFRAIPREPFSPAFAPTLASLSRSTMALHEYIGYGVYRALGYL